MTAVALPAATRPRIELAGTVGCIGRGSDVAEAPEHDEPGLQNASCRTFWYRYQIPIDLSDKSTDESSKPYIKTVPIKLA